MDNGPKQTAEPISEGKGVKYASTAMSVTQFQPNKADFQLLKTNMKAKKTCKQTTTEICCSEGLAKHSGSQAANDVYPSTKN